MGATAQRLLAALEAARRPEERARIEQRLGPGDVTHGIRMRDLFDAARAAADLPLDDVVGLLASPVYEVRMAAFCVLDVQARSRDADAARREALHRCYLDHHDRITTWDMVDRAAPSVVGGHLLGRDVGPLHVLARSDDPLRRRTAVTAPLWFLRHGDDADVAHLFPLAALLVDDPDPVVHRAVGIALKHSATRAPQALRAFLAEHAARMPRAVLRDAAAKLDPPP